MNRFSWSGLVLELLRDQDFLPEISRPRPEPHKTSAITPNILTLWTQFSDEKRKPSVSYSVWSRNGSNRFHVIISLRVELREPSFKDGFAAVNR